MAASGPTSLTIRSRRALRRWVADVWPLLQVTAAATVAWAIALLIGDHPDPFFAPIAAVAALSSPLGERGSNAVRLLLGVMVGIAVAELTIAVLGGGYGRLALATFAAMVLARALGGTRIAIVQAGGSAILTVAIANGEAGVHRLIDALIGAGVALTFSQVLFTPEPVALLRRAEATALTEMAEGLELTARALERDDARLAERAMNSLRGLRDHLAELSRVRHASARVVRHSAVWWSQHGPVVREQENAGHLDLLGGACVMLARTALAAPPPERRTLAPVMRVLVGALSDLAKAPGDRATRQKAVEHALRISREVAGIEPPADSAMAAAVAVMPIVASDIMIYAGVDSRQALEAVREGAGACDIPAPPPAPRLPFGLDRRRRSR